MSKAPPWARRPLVHGELGGSQVRFGAAVGDALLHGKVEKVHVRGRLADGRRIELVELDVPGWWLLVVVCEGRLLFASGGDDLSLHRLKVRGFVPDRGPAAARPQTSLAFRSESETGSGLIQTAASRRPVSPSSRGT